jgi:predicted permease
MNQLRQDVFYALRMFGKARAFSAVAVIVLAIGIGVNAAMFSLVNELLLRPRSGRVEDLVGVHSRDRTTPDSYRHFSYPNYADIRERRDLFRSVAAQAYAMVALGDDPSGRPSVLASVVSANYFDTLGATLAAGRPFTAEEERPGSRIPVALISYARWLREGRDPDILNRRITINGREYAVVGVAPEGFSGAMVLLSPEVFLPLGVFEAVVGDRFRNNVALGDRANEGLSLVAQPASGKDAASLSPALEVLSSQMEAAHPDENRHQVLSVHPLSRFSGGPTPQSNTAIGTLSTFLLTLSGTVLVIACLNIANMLLARGTARRKELAVRLALGAGRTRVIRQLLTESVLLAVAGAALGLVLSHWAMSALVASLSAVLPFSLSVSSTPDGAVLGVTLALAMTATIAFGLGPALRMSRRDLVVDLRDRGGDGAGTGRLFNTRNMLVVGQVALSLALLTAGGIFTRTVTESAAASPGFSYDGLIVGTVDTKLAGMDEARSRSAYVELAGRLRAIPGVTSATLASTIPFGDSIDSLSFERVGGGAQAPARARAFRIVGADYFESLGLSLIRGRDFTHAEEVSPDAPPVAIVDAAFAKLLFGDTDPIGQLIRRADTSQTGVKPGSDQGLTPTYEIIGIAPPLGEELLDKAPAAHVYVPSGRDHRAAMHAHVRLAPGVDAGTALDAVRKEIRAVDPGLPVLALSTFRAFHDRSLELLALRGSAGVFAGLGLLALVLSMVGVYGLRAYLVAQRTREIGIRMALGAGGREVMTLMLGDGFRLTAIGIALGLPLAIVVSLAFRSVFVDVGGIDLVVLGVSTAVLTAAALAASAVPARRAANVQPLAALRQD